MNWRKPPTMQIGKFIIMVSATNADRTEFYSDIYISPLHLTDFCETEEFAEMAAEEHFAHMPGVVIEKVLIKEVSEAQL